MARENQALAERVNASEQQLAGVTGSISEPRATPEPTRAVTEPPKAAPEPPKLASDDAPKVMPETPLPRPRAATRVAQAQKPAPRAARPPQAKKPQAAWPWSPR